MNTFGLLLPVLFLLLLAGAIAWQMRPRLSEQSGNQSIPGCGNCGYPARGLETLYCPECGSDLRQVGIAAPERVRRPTGTASLITYWSIGILLVGLVLSGVLVTLLPNPVHVNAHNTLQSRDQGLAGIDLRVEQRYWDRDMTMRSSSGSSGSIATDQTPSPLQLRHFEPGRPASRITMHLSTGPDAPSAGSASLTYQPQNDRIVSQQPDQDLVSTSASPAEAIEQWIEQAGYDLNDSTIRDEADELIQVVTALAHGQSSHTLHHLASTHHSSRRQTRVHPAIALGLLIFWAGLWGAGVYFIVLGQTARR